MTGTRPWHAVAALLLPVLAAAQGTLERVSEPIANGVITTQPPSVAWVLFPDGDCTGTLIGCRTVLSAAHCFCGEDDTGATCQPTTDAVVFLQHGGVFAVSSVTVHPQFVFGEQGDFAVVRLAQAVTGVTPAALNTVAKPSAGASGTIVGFGVDSESPSASVGLKRGGKVTVANCSQGIPNATHVCWSFGPPLGPAGEDSNTCGGDSGGPLFVDFGSGPRLAGVTSGGTGSCDGVDLAFDADVFHERTWIAQQAGADLGQTCGDLAPAGSAGSPVFVANGSLSAGNPSDAFNLAVPAGARRLRVALNGPIQHDFDLEVSPPGGGGGGCESQNELTADACEVVSPAAGTWRLEAKRFSGSGPFQLVATVFGAASGPPPAGPCVPDAATLCVDHQPGDRRFRVRIAYESVLGGGVQGDATAIPLAAVGVARGGLFAFTNPTNPEVLVKVLDGCPVNGRYWVFYSAATTLGFRLTVEDTLGDGAKTYVNPDQTAALPVTDTAALDTCP